MQAIWFEFEPLSVDCYSWMNFYEVVGSVLYIFMSGWFVFWDFFMAPDTFSDDILYFTETFERNLRYKQNITAVQYLSYQNGMVFDFAEL